MTKSLSRMFFFRLALSVYTFCQTGAHAQVPNAARPAGGAAAGIVAAPLPVEQRMGGTPEQTKVIALALGIAGFAAAISNGSTSANH